MDEQCLICVSLGSNFGKLLSYLKSHSQACNNAKFCIKIKIPKFVTKIPYVSIFGLKF